MKQFDTRALGYFVKDKMDSEGCCHDLMYTGRWLMQQGWTEQEIARWAESLQIACDCETINCFVLKPDHDRS